jgi:hypothetical protein
MKKYPRQFLKDFYKTQRHLDGKVGLKINTSFQNLHCEIKKKPEDRNVEYMKCIVEDIKNIKFNKRFREDFPSFAVFKKFFKKEKLTLQDLKDLSRKDI